MKVSEVRAEPLAPIPLPEVSGLAHAVHADGSATIAAIGDRAARIAVTRVSRGDAEPTWEVLDLTQAVGTEIPEHDPQLEAIATDGTGGVLLVQEWPNRAEYVDGPTRAVLVALTLEVPDLPAARALRRSWLDEDGSHAEGAVLLRDGHLLIVKEKDPAALIEFGPPGDEPGGFGRDRWHPMGQRWASWTGSQRLVALAAWYPEAALERLCPDLSDADEAGDGRLCVLSDKGRAIALVGACAPAAEPLAGVFTATEVWRLAGVAAKPEGIAVLPDGLVLVACDRAKERRNLFVLRDAPWG